MNAILYPSIIAVAMLSIFNLHIPVFATELNLTDSMTYDFAQNLKSQINNLVTNALNDTSNVLNSNLLSNESNQSSNKVILSQNTVESFMRSNASSGNDSSSIIKNKVTTTNGVCNSDKVGGNGNDKLYSSGNCNDMLTGGLGADKFTCGEGNDTIRDYNSKEGDVILDRQNCEEIL
jgi:Ca2+-binding RTX toxin-like protein